MSLPAVYLPPSSKDMLLSYFIYRNPRINAPGVYSYNRSEPPAFIRDPAFI